MDLSVINNFSSSFSLLTYSVAFTVSLFFTIIISYLLFRRDYKTVNLGRSLFVFLGGLLGVVLAVIIEGSTSNFASINKYLIWGVVEEIIKILPILFIIVFNKYKNKSEIIIYAIISALGFSLIENTLFLAGEYSGTENLYKAAFLIGIRGVGATFVHIVSSSIIAVCLALSIRKRTWLGVLPFGVIISVLIHFSWNYLVGTPYGLLIFGLLWLLYFIYFPVLEKIKFYLDEEVGYRRYVLRKVGALVLILLIWFIYIISVESFLPKYTERDLSYWKTELTYLKSTPPIVETDNEKLELESKQIIEIQNSMIKEIEIILAKMESNEDMEEINETIYDKYNRQMGELNKKKDLLFWKKELTTLEEVMKSWNSAESSMDTRRDAINKIRVLGDQMIKNTNEIILLISNGGEDEASKVVEAYNQKSKEFNDMASTINGR